MRAAEQVSVPVWLSTAANACFFSAVALGVAAVVGIVVDRRNRWMGWSVGTNLVTVCVIAWLTPTV